VTSRSPRHTLLLSNSFSALVHTRAPKYLSPFVLVLIFGTLQVLLSVGKVIAFTDILLNIVATTRDPSSDIYSFLTRLFLFLRFVYRLRDLPGPSIVDYTRQLISLSELPGLVTNKSTFSVIPETGQALT
jgi:hypothetical protein